MRVEAEIRRLNYRPNDGARNLRLAQLRTIGVIVVDESPRFLADPMTTNIVAGVSNCLSVNGFNLLIAGVTHATAAEAQMLRRDQTDALCVMPSGPMSARRALFQRLAETGQPIVVFQDVAPPFLKDALTVRQNDARGGELIAARVIDRGAKRMAMLIPGQDWPAINARRQGAALIADERGAKLDLIVCGSESLSDTQKAISRYVERYSLPDVFIGGNDQMAIGALNWALDRNISVPDDLRITGFNDFEFAGYVRPKLTTVSSPAYEMGKQGASQLLNRLANGSFSQTELFFEISLSIGSSD